MEQVAWQVGRQWNLGPTDGLCCLDVIACTQRPKMHFLDQGDLKDGVPFFCPSHKAGDVDNFLKLPLDALQGDKKRNKTGILYHDDCQVVSVSSHKVYADGRDEDLRGRGNVTPAGLILQFSLVSDDWRP